MSGLIERYALREIDRLTAENEGLWAELEAKDQYIKGSDEEVYRLQDRIRELRNEATSLTTENERLRAVLDRPSWDDYLKITEAWLRIYPPAIFTGESGDSGPLFVVAIRKAVQALEAEDKL